MSAAGELVLLDVATDALTDLERRTAGYGDADLDGWIEQAQLALLAAGGRLGYLQRRTLEQELAEIVREQHGDVAEVELERYGGEPPSHVRRLETDNFGFGDWI